MSPLESPVGPSHHDVWCQIDRDAPAHSVFISAPPFAESICGGVGTEGASRFTAPKLIGGPSLWRKTKRSRRRRGELERWIL